MLRVEPEPALADAPGVVIRSVGVEGGVTIGVLGIDAHVGVRAQGPAPPRRSEGALLVAGPGLEEGAMRLARTPGDDVDHAVDGVRSPQGAAGAADDFDAVDVLEQHVLDFPVGAGEQRRVDAPTVDEDQHRAREPAAEAAYPDRGLAGVDARDLHSGSEAQCFGQGLRARALDVLPGDDEGRGRRVRHRLRGTGHGGDLEAGQIGQGQLGEVPSGGRGRNRDRPAGQRERRPRAERSQQDGPHQASPSRRPQVQARNDQTNSGRGGLGEKSR